MSCHVISYITSHHIISYIITYHIISWLIGYVRVVSTLAQAVGDERSLRFWIPQFDADPLQIIKQFTHGWHLPWCQGMGPYSHVSPHQLRRMSLGGLVSTLATTVCGEMCLGLCGWRFEAGTQIHEAIRSLLAFTMLSAHLPAYWDMLSSAPPYKI